MNSTKQKLTAYWICTGLVGLSFLWGGAANLFVPVAIAGIKNLGYPAHFATILGVWKILGGVAILAPGFPRLKEWAYAGMIFDLTGAAAVHAVVGDSDWGVSNTRHIITPLVIAALVMASWALRRGSRRLAKPVTTSEPLPPFAPSEALPAR
jgi:hypothetical protein